VNLGTKTGRQAWLARCAAAGAVGALLLCCATAAFANPAVDQYKLRLPDAKGKSHDGEDPTPAPEALEALPAPTIEKLKHKKNGKALAAVATAPDLGAPTPEPHRTDGEVSTLGGLLRSLLDPVALLVLLAMGAIAVGGYRARQLEGRVSVGRRARPRAARR
jgi:hypothetical protein